MIPLFGGGEVRLDDLGTVTDTIADRRTFARFNGEPVVALGIKRSKGAATWWSRTPCRSGSRR